MRRPAAALVANALGGINRTKAAPGQNDRHVDMLWPLWNALDFTPAGRGRDWYPGLEYRT